MSNQPGVQVPEEAVEKLRDMEWAASCSVTDPPGGKDSPEWARIRLEAVLPSLIDHFKERLRDQAVIDAVAEQQAIAELYDHWNDGRDFPGMEENKRRRYAQLANKPGVQESWKAGVRKQVDQLLAAAFQDNTDSKEAPDGE
jgi:hypothetical protein